MEWGLDTEAWLVVMACSGISALLIIAYMLIKS
jgi:hypothetical protein